LLDAFWDSHNPVDPPWSTQYKAIIFFHNEGQRRLAVETRDREAAKRQRKVFTEIVPFTEFYPAESYHQKYSLRGESDLVKELNAMYPDATNFMNSTAAARLNGYLGGYGTLEVLQTELDSYGLSVEGRKKLLSLGKHGNLVPGCRL